MEPTNQTRIQTWIVGAGGVGCALAARLERAAPGSVTLVDGWVDNVRAIQANGLTVEYPAESVSVQPRAVIFDDLGKVGDSPELVVLAVKAYETAATLERLVPYIGDAAPVLSLQNSINEELIAETIGSERTIGGICLYDGALVAPGHGRQTMAHGKIVIGELDGAASPRIESTAAFLQASTPVRITNNIWGELWTKLIRNVMVNGVAAVTNLGMGELVLVPGFDRICIGLACEAVAVALRLGYQLETADLFDCPYSYPAEWYLQPVGSSLRDKLEQSFHDSWTPHPTVYPSMLQDIRKGRRTEVEKINGYVVEKSGGPAHAPLNVAITELVLECSATRRFPDQGRVVETLLPLVK